MTFIPRVVPLRLAVCLALSACASNPQPSPESDTPAAVKYSGATQPGSDMPAVAMLPPERVMRKGLHGPEAPGPNRLIGLNAGQVQHMLGRPDFKRHDPPAEIWQYRQSACMLDIFLYDTGSADGKYRVKYVEARGHNVNAVSGTDCLLEAIAN